MNYDHYMYLWPPRPERKITRDTIPLFEQRKWIAQKKKNGTNTLIFTNGTDVIYKTRRNEDHKAWAPFEEHNDLFRQTSSGLWNVFNGELLHSKTKHIKNHIYLFDMLVADNIHLVGRTYLDRYDLMLDQWPKTLESDQADKFVVSPYLSIARCYINGFMDLFENKLIPGEDEGLVIKKPDAPLNSCLQKGKNGSWQVKARIQTKNYDF